MNGEIEFSFEKMQREDIATVMAVDNRSFTLPWSERTYRNEVLDNNNSHYYVLRYHRQPSAPSSRLLARLARRKVEPLLVAYGGFWLVADEAHISTIAVDKGWRGQSLGEYMLMSMLEQAMRLSATKATLEVRESNTMAQNLYQKYGFHVTGKRLRYYRDNNEDALLMSLAGITTKNYQQKFQKLAMALLTRLRERGHSLFQGTAAILRD